VVADAVVAGAVPEDAVLADADPATRPAPDVTRPAAQAAATRTVLRRARLIAGCPSRSLANPLAGLALVS
jgi:hypothetical protein